MLVIALLLLWIDTPTASRLRKKRRGLAADETDELGVSLWTALKTLAVVLLAVAVFCVAALPLLSRASEPSQGGSGANPPSVAAPSSQARPGDSVHLGWLLLPIAVAFAILTPAAFLIRRRRMKRDEAPLVDDGPGALGRAVRASIVELESERDPRRAILRAYARMELAFRSVEIERGRDETASEFLGRTMRRVPVSAGAAAALTERFEEARYSTHAVTEADRGQALASLQRVERELGERS